MRASSTQDLARKAFQAAAAILDRPRRTPIKTDASSTGLNLMGVVVTLWSRPARLAHARRCVFEGAQRVAAQQRRLRRLRAGGYDASVAERLLGTFEDSQLALIARLALQEGYRRP